MIDYSLSDDGTLDTVVECHCLGCGKVWNERFSQEYTVNFRDPWTGAINDLRGLMTDANIYCECEE